MTYERQFPQGVPPLTRDGLQFDTRPDSPDSDTLIDLPLQDRESVRGADLPASQGDLLVQEPSSPSGGRGFGAGMLVIGLAAGFAGGFLVGQRVAPPPPRSGAAQVTPPAVSETRTAPEPPVVPAPLDATRGALSETRRPQNFTEAPVVEPAPPPNPPTPVQVQEPDTQPSVVRVPRPSTRSAGSGSTVSSVEPSTRSGRPEPVEGRSGPGNAGRSGLGPEAVLPGTLQIASRPPGAQVYVDDVRVGLTPLTMNNVKPGAHRVRIELPGHRPWATSVTVDPGAQARIGASLE